MCQSVSYRSNNKEEIIYDAKIFVILFTKIKKIAILLELNCVTIHSIYEVKKWLEDVIYAAKALWSEIM